MASARDVQRYRRHAQLYGPEEVYETVCAEGFSPRQRGALASFLRNLEPPPVVGSRTGKREPRWSLTNHQRDRLIRDLLAEDVTDKQIAKWAGCSLPFVRRTRADVQAETTVRAMLAEHGPIDLADAAVSEVGHNTLSRAIGIDPADSTRTAPPTSIDGATGGEGSVSGRRFGRLVVIGVQVDARRRRLAECQCDCGTTKTIRLAHLKSGRTKSCGCLLSEQRDRMRVRSKQPEQAEGR